MAALITAGLLFVGGAVSLIGIQDSPDHGEKQPTSS
jgi:hypothetical protein